MLLREIERLSASLADECAKETAARSAMSAYQKLDGIQDDWPRMSVQERRIVLASVIDSITISADYTGIKLKFGLLA